MGNGFHQHHYHVDIAEAVLHHLDHIVAQPVLSLVQSRRVHQHQLGVPGVHHTADTSAGSLRFVGHNGDFFAHQRIGQGRLAHIGPPAQGDHRFFCNWHGFMILNFPEQF